MLYFHLLYDRNLWGQSILICFYGDSYYQYFFFPRIFPYSELIYGYLFGKDETAYYQELSQSSFVYFFLEGQT